MATTRPSTVALVAACVALLVVSGAALTAALPLAAHHHHHRSGSALDAATDAAAGAQVGVRYARAVQVRVLLHNAAPIDVPAGCTVTADTLNSVPMDEAVVPLRTCGALLAALGLTAGAAVVPALPALDASWVRSVHRRDPGQLVGALHEHQLLNVRRLRLIPLPPTPPGPPGPPGPLAPPGPDYVVTLQPLTVVFAQLVPRQQAAAAVVAGAGTADPDPTVHGDPVACAVGLTVPFSAALVTACGHRLHRTLSDRQQPGGGLPAVVVPPYAFARDDVARVSGLAAVPAFAAATPLPTGTVVALHEPVPVEVRVDRPAPGLAPVVHTLWVARSDRRAWNAALVAALNARAAATPVAGWTALGTGDVRSQDAALTLTFGGVRTAWDGPLLALADRPVVIEALATAAAPGGPSRLSPAYFPPVVALAADGDGVVQARQLASETRLVTPATAPGVVYVNAASGEFAAPLTRTAAVQAATRALLAAAGLAAGAEAQLDPLALYTRLVDDRGASGGASRQLKRDLEAAHGRVTTHFGFVYALLKVAVGRGHAATAGASPWTYVGFLSAADNLPVGVTGTKGAGAHTEQRLLEQIRRFVVALEATAPGTTRWVTQVQSRWITDYFPDRLASNNCRRAFQYTALCAERDRYRTCRYTEPVRAWAPPKTASETARRNLLVTHLGTAMVTAAGGPTAPTKALQWVAPVGHRVYHHGCRQIEEGKRTERKGDDDEVDPDGPTGRDMDQRDCREHARAASGRGGVPDQTLEDEWAPATRNGQAWHAMTA